MIDDPLKVPFSVPDVGEEEACAVAGVLKSGWLTTGSEAEQFEREFRAYTGAEHALAISSCTAGLHLALSALGIGPGDEVITTPLTFCGTIQAIEETGAKPVLSDVGAGLNLDARLLERTRTNRTRAILPVHLAGHPCDLDEIWEFAARHELFVIEDAAHAVGAAYRGRRIGSGRSDAIVFSFYANKNLTTGEGGMVTCNRRALASRMRLMSWHGIKRAAQLQSSSPSWYYEVAERGFKYNLSDIQAAIGRCQLRKLESGLARRSEIAAYYLQRLAAFEEIELPENSRNSSHAWHLFIIRLKLERLAIDRDAFTLELCRRGIGCSVHFIPVPLHPYYRSRFAVDGLTEALRQYPRLVSLPIYPSLTEEQAKTVVEAVGDIVARHRRTQFFHAGVG
jgi:dTDP-4-amino-4,6-dideoxygalactose transaminase